MKKRRLIKEINSVIHYILSKKQGTYISFVEINKFLKFDLSTIAGHTGFIECMRVIKEKLINYGVFIRGKKDSYYILKGNELNQLIVNEYLNKGISYIERGLYMINNIKLESINGADIIKIFTTKMAFEDILSKIKEE